MSNKLLNGDFEADWSEGESHWCCAITDLDERMVETDNIFSPPGWIPWFTHNSVFAQPEGRDARSTNPPRMRSGTKGYLLFTFGRMHNCGLLQQCVVPPGARIKFSIYAHAWSNHKNVDFPQSFPQPDNPLWSEGAGYDQVAWKTSTLVLDGDTQNDAKQNFSFSVGINVAGGLSPSSSKTVWSDKWSIYNGYVKQLTVEAVAESSIVTVFTRSTTKWPFKHNDAYWDDAELVIVEQPTSHRGAPRVQYERTYNVIPQSASVEEAHKILDLVFDKKQTLGWSSDDAGTGDLDMRSAVEWNRPKEQQPNYTSFYNKYYPGVNVSFESLTKPDTLYAPPGEIISLHVQDRIEGALALSASTSKARRLINALTIKVLERRYRNEIMAASTGFTSTIKPEWIKCMIAEQAREFIQAGAKYVVQRYHIDGRYNLYAVDKNAEAKRIVDMYAGSLEANKQWIAAVEGTNEEPNSNNPDKNKHVVDLEIAILRELERRGFPPIASPNIAIGNVEESDLPIFLPLVREIVRVGGYWTYHSYWPIQGNNALPESEWKWFDERFMWHWEYFAKNGLYPKILLTECGPCGFMRRTDGGFGGFLATHGWRNDNVYTGTVAEKRVRYFESVLKRRERWNAWNKEHGYPLRAVTLYTVNQAYSGWSHFRHLKDDMQALGVALAA